MVTEAIATPLLWLFDALVGLLPQWEPELPGGMEAISTRIAQFDSIIPVGGPIQLAATVLLFGGVFLVIRFTLMVRHVLLP